MKRILICGLLFVTSCKTWDGDDKDMFYQSCMDDARTWAGSEANAKTYCDCTIAKVMKKFPDETDALEHIDSVINDPDVRACRLSIAANKKDTSAANR